MSKPEQPQVPPREFEDLEAELAAALPETQGRRFFPLIRRWALHVIPFLLLGAAAYVLWREFHEISPVEVARAMAAWGAAGVLLALGLSAASFLLMGVVEWLGLRWTGARVSWPQALAGSFLANAIAHALGANLLVSAAVRARVYDRYGVNLKQVAGATLFHGLSFAVGISALAGVSLLLAGADALAPTRIPPMAADLAGTLLVGGVSAYIFLCGVRKRPLRAFGHSLKLPSAPVAVAQTCVGAVDNAIAAAIIWTLLPPGTVNYFSFVGAYAVSVVAGLASTVPAGAGVFESVLSTLLPRRETAALAAAFLGYRLAYFILPLILAALALGGDTLLRPHKR